MLLWNVTPFCKASAHGEWGLPEMRPPFVDYKEKMVDASHLLVDVAQSMSLTSKNLLTRIEVEREHVVRAPTLCRTRGGVTDNQAGHHQTSPRRGPLHRAGHPWPPTNQHRKGRRRQPGRRLCIGAKTNVQKHNPQEYTHTRSLGLRFHGR